MRRFSTILLIIVAVMAVLMARHRRILRAVRDVDAAPRYESVDPAATLRQLTGKHGATDADKGWAIRFAQFVNDHPGRQWVVGRCEKPCLSEAEAAEQARDDASTKVYPAIARHMGVSRFDAQLLRDRVIQDVRDGRLEADRFAEQFNRPYGQVWTESVLLDVSPENLDSLGDRYQAELSVLHRQTGKRFGAAAVVILLTCLLYILLNIATKGYFTMRLRLASIVIVAAVIILLV